MRPALIVRGIGTLLAIGYWLFAIRHSLLHVGHGRAAGHEEKVETEAQRKGDEPGVRVQCVEKARVLNDATGDAHRVNEAGNDGENREDESDYRARVDAIRIRVRTL